MSIEKSKKGKTSAFTLVELIVVITILAILATIGFLALSGYSQDAKESAIKANVRSVQTAISSEAAIMNNSPRYYVVHDTGAALSGATVYVDGNPTVLTWGDWNVSGTNYSAGNPDWAKLKMNPEKFKLSKLWRSLNEALAAYDPKSIGIGAFDWTVQSNGKPRSGSWFQVVGVSPATGMANVAGNFPTSLSWSVSGLVRDPAKSSTGALVDGSAGSTAAVAVPITDKALTFNGSTKVTFSKLLPDSSEFTIETWASVGNGYFVTDATTAGGNDTFFGLTSTQLFARGDKTSSSGYAGTDAANHGLASNSSIHQLTVTAKSGTVTFYVDGNAVGSAARTLTNNGAHGLVIGCWSDTAGSSCSNYYSGIMSEMRFYWRALTSGEVSSGYSWGPNRPLESGILAAWNFQEGAGSSLADYSGNGYVWTISTPGAWVNP